VGNLYFALLELSPEKSTQLVPAFVSHYFLIEEEHVRVIYHKNLQFLLADQDVGNYVDRLSDELGKSFWSILIRTNLSKRLFAVPKGISDPISDDELPMIELVLSGADQNSPFKATSARNDIKILAAQVEEAANNPELVRTRIREFQEWTDPERSQHG